MNRVGLLVFISFLLLFSFSRQAFGQNISNEGTDFWVVFPTHVPNPDAGLADIKIYLTSKYNTEAIVTCGNYSSGPITVTANSSIGVIVPRSEAYIDLTDANKVLINRGIHIKVSDGKPKVSAYAHIFAGLRSAASLILPFETLGQQYYSVNYTQQLGNANNFLALVAVEDNTNLILHPKSGAAQNITLSKAGDVFEYVLGRADLTGVFVEINTATSSCKRFAAFSGTSNVAIGDCNSTSGSDPLYQQLYPLSSLGKTYGIVPFSGQSYLYRAIATEDNTKIFQNGQQLITLNKGEFYTSDRQISGAYVTGDKNFILAQYMYSSSCASISGTAVDLGDPDMVILNPVEFSIKEITVFSSTDQNIADRYLNILIKANKTSSFKINGISPNTQWTPLPGNQTYAYAQIQVTATSLTLTADDGFNAIAYGYGQKESYAYSAGTNLATNNYLTVVNETKNEESPNGCIGENVDFKVNLPYQPDRITWTLEGLDPTVIDNPVSEIKTVNGQVSYIYNYPVDKIYTVTGEYHLNVLAHVPNTATSCVSGDITTNYIFTIYDLPTAKFETETESCSRKDVTFVNKSTSNSVDFVLTNWLWDFGDGTTSTLENPVHQYAKEGLYTISLSVKSGTGCYSEPMVQKITVFPLPVSKFISSNYTCINTNYTVTDQSTLIEGTITNWHWDFGDGYEMDQVTAASFAHQYQQPGKYIIKLTTTSDKGCLSEVFSKEVTVTDLPLPDFKLPDVCLSDPSATFINTSVDVAGSNGNLIYEWNFGDAGSSALNPNSSTSRDGKHTYVNFGIYQVTLKITNSNGCVSTKTKEFTVNGGVERASFVVQNEDKLCSNSDVLINNNSTAFFGKITRIEIYKDYINQPTSFETIFSPTSSDIHLVYNPFGGMNTKSITIRLVAYSGESCSKSFEKTIVLKPSAQLVFSEIPNVCQNDGSVLLNQASETSGIVGMGQYSGDGIEESGIFNPKLVGIGTHTVTYTFTPANGCSASISQNITVNESPTANAGAIIYVLAGGQMTIPTVVTGKDLFFKWTPATGLDHDDVQNPTASPDRDTEYHLLVSTINGCLTTTSVVVKVLGALNPPNSFTPNGDGVNDYWNIKSLDSYPNATVEIFNRNGQRIYSSSNYKIPFDGNFQNVPLPVGVYYYIINPRNGRKTVTGPLTIIR